MLKVNLIEELERKNVEITESPSLAAAQLLLEGTAQEERTILREAGLDSNFAQLEKEVGINLERTKIEKEFNTKFFTEAEVKELCVKYKLKFLPSRDYKGVIDPVLGAKLLRFFQERNIGSTSHEASNNLFVMAPSTAFNFHLVSKPVPVDPILFYRVRSKERNGENLYAIVHKWGNDFSISRRLVGAWFATTTSYFLTNWTLFAIIANVVIASFGFNPFHWGSLLISIGVGFITQGIFWMRFNSSDSSHDVKKYESRISSLSWDKNFKYE